MTYENGKPSFQGPLRQAPSRAKGSKQPPVYDFKVESYECRKSPKLDGELPGTLPRLQHHKLENYMGGLKVICIYCRKDWKELDAEIRANHPKKKN